MTSMTSTRAGRKYVLILVIQSVLMLTFLVFGLVQRQQKIMQRELTEQATELANRNAKEAAITRQLAEQQAQLAQQQMAIAQANAAEALRALKNCGNKK